MSGIAAARSAVVVDDDDDGGGDAAAAAVAAAEPATKVAVLLNETHLQLWTASACSPTVF